MQIHLKTLTETTHYTVTYNQDEKKLTVALNANGIAQLDANEKVIVSVDTKINGNAAVETDIPNKFKLRYGHDPNNTVEKESNEAKVITGGRKFIKHESGKQDKTLANAVFALHDGLEVNSPALTWTDKLLKINEAAIKAGKLAIKNGDDFGKATLF